MLGSRSHKPGSQAPELLLQGFLWEVFSASLRAGKLSACQSKQQSLQGGDTGTWKGQFVFNCESSYFIGREVGRKAGGRAEPLVVFLSGLRAQGSRSRVNRPLGLCHRADVSSSPAAHRFVLGVSGTQEGPEPSCWGRVSSLSANGTDFDLCES